MKTKNSYLILIALIGCIFTTSCLKDDFVVDWNEAKKTTIIELPYKQHNLLASAQVPTAPYTFSKLLVNCCAIYASDIKADIAVGLAVDASRVATYNTANGLDGSTAARRPYVAMPTAAYSIPGTVTIKAGIREAEFDVPINTSLLEPGQKYLIPIVITSVPAPYVISGNFGHLYLRVDMR